MGYYVIHITYRASLLTAFILPFEKYRWLRLSMKLSAATDHFQARITRLLKNFPLVRCYRDEVVIPNGWKSCCNVSRTLDSLSTY
ncbi:hypothetical protein PHYSODRAFT_507756 [Phytophthora sojae]|uniref:Uncharacterized protein n=1 Tax=Phytophthora sojae (strain P6497) TaxID=1094619 RepID=G4ZL97_PHYSP|nr:hypothetical protein PHYSODRAFT_507756 [Phytophthora sojae]EGZ15611.1 hypothetical protein PHYSODRAFT_507756 [Phytophthora sojae]|eukprot:XP_009529360.1 hypothetical protein PHYSODRAFT_507756 [Phytophthora sojae]